MIGPDRAALDSDGNGQVRVRLSGLGEYTAMVAEVRAQQQAILVDAAPPGHATLSVLEPTANTARGHDWAALGPQLRARLFPRLAALGYGDLEGSAELEALAQTVKHVRQVKDGPTPNQEGRAALTTASVSLTDLVEAATEGGRCLRRCRRVTSRER